MSFDTVYTYLPDKIKVLVGDVYLEGWEKISVDRLYPAARQVIGIRGKNTKVRNQNNALKVTVTLSQSSDSNKLFQFIANAEEDHHSVISFSLLIEDLSGGTAIEAFECYLEGVPKTVDFSGSLALGTVGYSSRCWSLLPRW